MYNALQKTDIQNGFCKRYWMGGLTCGDLCLVADIDATLTIAMLTTAMLTTAMLTKPSTTLSCSCAGSRQLPIGLQRVKVAEAAFHLATPGTGSSDHEQGKFTGLFRRSNLCSGLGV